MQKLIKQDSKIVNNLADLALASMLKIWARVSKSYRLQKYKVNPLLAASMPNKNISMGFGLH
jgi:hypothetical protein